MKVIDILNKIANGEEVPKKIAYTNKTYLFEGEISNYVNEYSKYDFLIGEDITALLNDEVEIIEEDKKIPEKLDERILLQRRIEDVGIPLKEMLDKINEIIDYLEEKE